MGRPDLVRRGRGSRDAARNGGALGRPGRRRPGGASCARPDHQGLARPPGRSGAGARRAGPPSRRAAGARDRPPPRRGPTSTRRPVERPVHRSAFARHRGAWRPLPGRHPRGHAPRAGPLRGGAGPAARRYRGLPRLLRRRGPVPDAARRRPRGRRGDHRPERCVGAPGRPLPADLRRQRAPGPAGARLRRPALPARGRQRAGARTAGPRRAGGRAALRRHPVPPPAPAEGRQGEGARRARRALGRGCGGLRRPAHGVHRHRLRGTARLRAAPRARGRPNRPARRRPPARPAALAPARAGGGRAQGAAEDVQEGGQDGHSGGRGRRARRGRRVGRG